MTEAEAASSATQPREMPTRVVRYTPNRVDVGTGGPGWLVLSDQYFPGWTAVEAGDSRLPVRRANGLLRAVHVPARETRVSFRYEPTSVRLGVFLTLAALALLTGVATAAFSRRRGVPAPPPA
jgi:uncharacterized membrane protein YfhO